MVKNSPKVKTSKTILHPERKGNSRYELRSNYSKTSIASKISEIEKLNFFSMKNIRKVNLNSNLSVSKFSNRESSLQNKVCNISENPYIQKLENAIKVEIF